MQPSLSAAARLAPAPSSCRVQHPQAVRLATVSGQERRSAPVAFRRRQASPRTELVEHPQAVRLASCSGSVRRSTAVAVRRRQAGPCTELVEHPQAAWVAFLSGQVRRIRPPGGQGGEQVDRGVQAPDRRGIASPAVAAAVILYYNII